MTSSNSSSRTTITCHYAILGVALDADASTIKKAHRRLALQYHPDKNIGDNNNNNNNNTAQQQQEQFQLVQQAYECLSDATERKWYDEHREAILKGWSADGMYASGGGANTNTDMLFDVEPFMYAGCYRGFVDNDKDDDDSFYAVYRRVFGAVLENEQQGTEFDIDSGGSNNASALQRDFGTSQTPWEEVAAFYRAWESFSSCLNFAWADPYNAMEADNRRVRRAMEEENKKKRRLARRTRNEEISALVRFVKRRDPRVEARREAVEQEKLHREGLKQVDAAQRKRDALEARERWRLETEKAMTAAEEEDRLAGRLRLADLDDEYEYGGKKKKGKKKGRKKGEEEGAEVGGSEQDGTSHGAADAAEKPIIDHNTAVEENDTFAQSDTIGTDKKIVRNNEPPETGIAKEQHEPIGIEDDANSSKDSDLEYEEKEMPDTWWRCECCRKDFKSEGQMENHMRSKKHLAQFVKFGDQ
jgi:DnaJ homolog subfamily A member 5